MTAPSPSARLLLLVLLSVVLSLATVPLVKLAIEAALPGPDGLNGLVKLELGPATEGPEPSYTYDIGRISRRWLMVVALALFVGLRRWVPWSALVRRGLRRTPDRLAQLGFGLAAGFVLVVAYVAVVAASGMLGWRAEGVPGLGWRAVDYVLGAALIALLEEVFFRGVLFRTMLRDWGACAAVAASSALFAVLHCISGGLRTGPGWDPTLGLRLLEVYFTIDGSPWPDLRLMVGLFLFGCLLCALYLRTGALWVPIGLHAGLVFASKLSKPITERTPDFPEWLFGDRLLLVSGVACWALLAVALVVVVRLAPRGPLARRRARPAAIGGE